MITVTLALIPIFLIILLGYLFLRWDFPGQAFWPLMEKIIYFVLFPCLLFDNLFTAPLHQLNVIPLATVLVLTVLLMAGILILIRPWLPVGGPEFTSIFQGSIRFNGYIAIALVTTLKIPSGLALAAVALAAMVPLINVLCVIVLAHYASHEPTRISSIVSTLLRNPLIIACILGILLNYLHIRLPSGLPQAIAILADTALPFGLLAVGAGLRFGAIRAGIFSLLFSMAFKLLLFPTVIWLICQWWHLGAAATQVAILFTAVPTATSAYILARQMGGDYTLMANIISFQTLVAAATLPFVLTNLR